VAAPADRNCPSDPNCNLTACVLRLWYAVAFVCCVLTVLGFISCGRTSATVDMLPDELLMIVLGLVDTRSLLTSVAAVCTRWRRLCRDVRGIRLDIGFLKDHPRVRDDDGASILTVLFDRWRWVDALIVDGWKLAHRNVTMLLDAWPTLTTIRCGSNLLFFVMNCSSFVFAICRCTWHWFLSKQRCLALLPPFVLCCRVVGSTIGML